MRVWTAPTAPLIALLAWSLTAFSGLAEATPLTDPAELAVQSSDEKSKRESPTDLQYDTSVSVPLLTAAIAGVALPADIFRTPPACRWCDGATPNRVDRWARQAKWENPCRAARLSYWTLGAVGLAALGPLSHESSGREWLTNAGIVADSVAVTGILTQVAKYSFRRERPNGDPCHPATAPEGDRNLSFFSGHTAIAFALISSARETARLRGHSSNEWVLVGGLSAAATGYLRVAGDRHHLIDVLAGASVGYFVGRFVPRHFHHRPPAAPMPAGDGRATTVSTPPAVLGFVQPVMRGNRPMLVQFGKGPGRSIQIGVSF
jgi:membrane-associated phospholipid phosphatase